MRMKDASDYFVLSLVLGCAGVFLVASDCSAQGEAQEEMVQRIEEMISVGPEPPRHCRQGAGASDTWRLCRTRLMEFVDWFYMASGTYEVRAETLAAIAMVESRFSPDAISRSGAVSIMQLVPRWFPELRFGVDGAHTIECLATTGACQDEPIMKAAERLAEMITFCGSEAEAIGYYNTGECQVNGYVRSVLRARRILE